MSFHFRTFYIHVCFSEEKNVSAPTGRIDKIRQVPYDISRFIN